MSVIEDPQRTIDRLITMNEALRAELASVPARYRESASVILDLKEQLARVTAERDRLLEERRSRS